MHWFDSHTWVVTGLVSLLAIAVSASLTVAIFRKNRERKTLDFEIKNDVDLISSHAPRISDLKVIYQSDVLDAPRIVSIKFINSGNKLVVADDFVEPIRVKHGDDEIAKDAFVVAQSTPGIIGAVFDEASGARTVAIKPQLLNPGEHFTVQFLYDGHEKLAVWCRFKGQSRPMVQLNKEGLALSYSMSDKEIRKRLRDAGYTGWQLSTMYYSMIILKSLPLRL